MFALLKRFDARVGKRFVKPYLVDLSAPQSLNWRGLLSSVLFVTLFFGGVALASAAYGNPLAQTVGIVAAACFWALAVPLGRYWWLSGRKRYPFPSVGKLKYFVSHNSQLMKKGKKEYVDSQGRMSLRSCVESCACFYVFEDEEIIVVRALKLADDYNAVVSKLDDGLAALFSLPVEIKDDQLDYCDYVFMKSPDDRIVMDAGISAPSPSLPKNEISLSSGLVWKLDKQPHCLCAGGTGSGKSTFINYLIREFLLRDAVVFIADPKQSDLAALGQVLGSERVASTPNQIARIVRECRDLMETRYAAHLAPESFRYGTSWVDWSERPVILFFDELGAFRAGAPKKVYDETFGYLSEVILKGRQAGVFVMLSAQQPRSETVSTDIRDQMALRVGLGNLSSECARMVFGSADTSDLRSVSAPGEGYIMLDGLGWNAPKPFSAPFVDYAGMDFMQEISTLYAASSMAGESKLEAECDAGKEEVSS